MGEPTGQQTADSAPAEPTVEGTPQGDQGSTVPADVVPAPSAEEMPEGLGEKAQERFRTLARERTEAKGELEKMQAEVAAVKEARQKLVDSKPAVFFAYNKDAGPRSINGYPIFFSVEWVTEAEWLKIVQYLKKLEQFEKELEV